MGHDSLLSIVNKGLFDDFIETIKRNISCVEIDLSEVLLGDKGKKALFEALKVNVTLAGLHTDDNDKEFQMEVSQQLAKNKAYREEGGPLAAAGLINGLQDSSLYDPRLARLVLAHAGLAPPLVEAVAGTAQEADVKDVINLALQEAQARMEYSLRQSFLGSRSRAGSASARALDAEGSESEIGLNSSISSQSPR